MNSMILPIGFMQGRLCDPVNGQIQSFPWYNWESEFSAAASLGLHLMEWTLDQALLYQNPLLTQEGQEKIVKLCKQFSIAIPSLTGDCFMQAPFWKVSGIRRSQLQDDFLCIARAAAFVGISMIVVPLVDNGRLENVEQERILIDFLLSHQEFFRDNNIRIVLESDFCPDNLARFISLLPDSQFGINYDIGNSAALGYNPSEEFTAYGHRVVNVHVKDRVRCGTTVPLLSGDVDFPLVFFELIKSGFCGNYILQTARALDGNHADLISKYRDMVSNWIRSSNAMYSTSFN